MSKEKYISELTLEQIHGLIQCLEKIYLKYKSTIPIFLELNEAGVGLDVSLANGESFSFNLAELKLIKTELEREIIDSNILPFIDPEQR